MILATKDEICPSTPMSEKIVTRLKTTKFKHYFDHIAIKGQGELLKLFNLVLIF